MKNNFYRTNFDMTFLSNGDVLKVNKCNGSDWTGIKITCRDDDDMIQLRSLEAVQSLHFMLGKLLEKSASDNEESRATFGVES